MSDPLDPPARIVGIEASVTSSRAVCLDGTGEIVGTETTPVNSSEPAVPQLNAFISKLASKFGSFDRIGIAVPGLIRRESGRVAYSAHIPEHSAIDISDEIAKSTGVKAVIENDANAAAYGELKVG